MSTYIVGQIPFETVYLHGLVRDAKGQKISKSLGNNIDPVDMIAKYGSDAIRMALIVGTAPGNDSKISEDKFKAYKLFANKIWNITRYVLTASESWDGKKPTTLSETDTARLAEFQTLITDVTTDMDTYHFYLAAEKLYHYVWHTFADVIIEESKEQLQSTDAAVGASAQYTLRYILETSLTLLHPFMPFITEEIWSHIARPLTDSKKLLMVTAWPT